MSYDFDQLIERRDTNSIKWRRYDPDVLPLWVADMDFASPEAVQAALKKAVSHGIFGYEMPSRRLAELVTERMERLYGWGFPPEAVVTTPGVIAGFTAAARATCAPGEGVLVQPPVYPPFLTVHMRNSLVLREAQLRCQTKENIVRYEIDWDVLEEAAKPGGGRTAMFLLCNPHNPTGQIFGKEELFRVANICEKNDMILCSDEIHSELLLGGSKFTPAAALSDEIGKRTITLIAPSKTFNIAGLFCGFAIIPDTELRKKFRKALEGMAGHVNSLGLIAAEAAYSGECDEWLEALCTYLTNNRDLLLEKIKSDFPDIHTTMPAATYLAWLDYHPYLESKGLSESAHEFFLNKARVALNDGAEFGQGGEGFVRLNFGCPRAILEEALDRMKSAMA